MAKTKLEIRGMSCQHCVKTVTDTLTALEGVQRVKVNLRKGEAVVRYAPDDITDAKLAEAITAAGFQVVTKTEPLSLLLLIGGILIPLLSTIGCSDMPYTGSMLTAKDVDRYVTISENSACLLSGDESICITLIPETDDESRPIIHIHPGKVIYVFYREGVPIMQAEMEMDTTEIMEEVRGPGEDDPPPDDDGDTQQSDDGDDGIFFGEDNVGGTQQPDGDGTQEPDDGTEQSGDEDTQPPAPPDTIVPPEPPDTELSVPSVPQNLRITPGDSLLIANWDPPAENGGALIDGYEVRINSQPWINKGALERSHTFDGLTNNEQATISVRAHNSVGYSPITTATGTPTAPTQPTSEVSNTRIQVKGGPDNPKPLMDSLIDLRVNTGAAAAYEACPAESKLRVTAYRSRFGAQREYQHWTACKNENIITITLTAHHPSLTCEARPNTHYLRVATVTPIIIITEICQ